MAVKFLSRSGADSVVTLHCHNDKRRPAGQGKNQTHMTQTNTRSNAAQNETKNAAEQQVVIRHIETRDQWDVIFAHSVALVVAHIRGQQVTDPRKGFKFGKTDVQPHARGYAQSLLTGFTTSKAGKVLAENDDLADKANRVKIATAILLSTKLAKDGDEGAKRIMDKSKPKREKAFAQAVLAELAKPVEEPEAKSEAAPKGAKANGKAKAAPKGAKANDKAKAGK